MLTNWPSFPTTSLRRRRTPLATTWWRKPPPLSVVLVIIAASSSLIIVIFSPSSSVAVVTAARSVSVITSLSTELVAFFLITVVVAVRHFFYARARYPDCRLCPFGGVNGRGCWLYFARSPAGQIRMSGCLDRVSCDCECSEPFREWIKKKRNMFASIISGTLVSYHYFTDHFNIFFTTVRIGMVVCHRCLCWTRWADICSLLHLCHLLHNCSFNVSLH